MIRRMTAPLGAVVNGPLPRIKHARCTGSCFSSGFYLTTSLQSYPLSNYVLRESQNHRRKLMAKEPIRRTEVQVEKPRHITRFIALAK
jgi:hypothetical protein